LWRLRELQSTENRIQALHHLFVIYFLCHTALILAADSHLDFIAGATAVGDVVAQFGCTAATACFRLYPLEVDAIDVLGLDLRTFCRAKRARASFLVKILVEA